MNDSPEYNIHVHTLGGTISCGEFIGDEPYDPEKHQTGQVVRVVPEKGKIKRLFHQHVDKRTLSRAANIKYSEARLIKDSARYKVKDLMDIVADTRKKLEEGDNSLLLPAGTDSAAALIHAIAEGVPQDLLGDRSIVVAVSNDHTSVDNPPTNRHPAIRSLTNALYLMTCEQMRGRIGVCTGLSLHSPRGLQKISTTADDPFIGRFDPIAIASDKAVPEWRFSEPRRPHELPRGREHPYILSSGIETWVLSPTSEYENIVSQFAGSIEVPEARGAHSKMRGVILQAPGTANLVEDKRELEHIELAAAFGYERGIPLVLIADPLQAEKVDWSREPDKNRGYGGSFAVLEPLLDEMSKTQKTHVINGGELTRTEAQLLVSAAVARAREQHGYKGGEIVDYVKKYLADYLDDMTGE